MENPEKFLKNTKIINFDIIHHKSRGDVLEKPVEYYQTMFENNFIKHLNKTKKDSC